MAELANGRRGQFEAPLERDLDLFLGVGGSGRSPLNPPTPKGAGVRVNQEKKGEWVLAYREVIKIVVKCSLSRAGGQGAEEDKQYPRAVPPSGLPHGNASLNPALAGGGPSGRPHI